MDIENDPLLSIVADDPDLEPIRAQYRQNRLNARMAYVSACSDLAEWETETVYGDNPGLVNERVQMSQAHAQKVANKRASFLFWDKMVSALPTAKPAVDKGAPSVVKPAAAAASKQ